MPQVTINYKKPETLKVLKSLGKYLGFDVIKDKTKPNALADLLANEQHQRVKSILVPGDKSLNIDELREVFSGKDIDAKELRRSAWERKK